MGRLISDKLEMKELHIVVQWKTRSWQQFSSGSACHKMS